MKVVNIAPFSVYLSKLGLINIFIDVALISVDRKLYSKSSKKNCNFKTQQGCCRNHIFYEVVLYGIRLKPSPDFIAF